MNKKTILGLYDEQRSSSSRATISTVTAIAVASAVLLVSTLAVVPLVEQAHALDIRAK